MADIHEVVTLGIGTPSSIAFFIRLGIGSGATVALTEADPCDTFYVMAEDSLTAAADSATFAIGTEAGFVVTSDSAFVVPSCR